MTKCSILMGIYEFGTGGAEVLARNLAIDLRDRGLSIAVMATHGEDGPVSEQLRQQGIPCVTARSHALNPVSRRIQLYRIFNRFRPSLFHAHHTSLFQYCYWPARLACAPRTVVTEHTDFEFLRFDIDRESAKFAAAKAHIVTTVHEGMATSYRNVTGINSARLKVIENGVKTDIFHPAAANGRLRAQLGMDSDQVLIGFVGRLHEQKNVNVLLDAMPQVVAADSCARLVVIGDGPEDECLIQQAKALGVADKVTFTGRIEDIPSVLPELDIFVLPSKTEGLSIALLEAMSAGSACIATNVGANESILDGGAGLLVPSGDSNLLGEAISKLCADKDLRETLGRRARQVVQQRYEEKRCFDRYLSLFEAQLARR